MEQRCELLWFTYSELLNLDNLEINFKVSYLQNLDRSDIKHRLAAWPFAQNKGISKFGVYFSPKSDH